MTTQNVEDDVPGLERQITETPGAGMRKSTQSLLKSRPTSSEMPTLRFVRSVWESFRATSGLEPRLVDGLRVTAAALGKVNFELDILKEHTNRLNILHGGTIASMVDLGGSLAVASRGLFSTGVSTDLNVTYISSGGRIGDTIRAEVSCDKMGKTMAFTSVQFFNNRGELFARGSHTKYVALAWKDPNNIVEQLQKLEQERKTASDSADPATPSSPS